jgi:hypothetical protein
LINEGDGTFLEIQYYTGGDKVKAFAVAPFDDDATQDLAVISSTSDRDLVYLFFNSGLDLLPPPVIDNMEKEVVPYTLTLAQNYPNPFNPKTTINYELPVSNKVELSIFNILGQKVVQLVSGNQQAGTYQVKWDASGFSSGIYFYRLKTENQLLIRKMMLLK